MSLLSVSTPVHSKNSSTILVVTTIPYPVAIQDPKELDSIVTLSQSTTGDILTNCYVYTCQRLLVPCFLLVSLPYMLEAKGMCA